MSPREIEKIKLTATFLDGVAIAVIAVGGLADLRNREPTVAEIAAGARHAGCGLPHRRRRLTSSGPMVSEQAGVMTDLEYVLLTSIMPVGALIMAGIIILITRPRSKDRPHPGE